MHWQCDFKQIDRFMQIDLAQIVQAFSRNRSFTIGGGNNLWYVDFATGAVYMNEFSFEPEIEDLQTTLLEKLTDPHRWAPNVLLQVTAPKFAQAYQRPQEHMEAYVLLLRRSFWMSMRSVGFRHPPSVVRSLALEIDDDDL